MIWFLRDTEYFSVSNMDTADGVFSRKWDLISVTKPTPGRRQSYETSIRINRLR